MCLIWMKEDWKNSLESKIVRYKVYKCRFVVGSLGLSEFASTEVGSCVE